MTTRRLAYRQTQNTVYIKKLSTADIIQQNNDILQQLPSYNYKELSI
jgi:hypothetical protein